MAILENVTNNSNSIPTNHAIECREEVYPGPNGVLLRGRQARIMARIDKIFGFVPSKIEAHDPGQALQNETRPGTDRENMVKSLVTDSGEVRQ